MAVLNGTSFVSKWHARFADNVSREITEAFLREFVTDVKDSFFNSVDFVAPSASFSSITGNALDNASIVGVINETITTIRGGAATDYNTLLKLYNFVVAQLELKQDVVTGIHGGTP